MAAGACFKIDWHQLQLSPSVLQNTDRRTDRSVDLPLLRELPMTPSSMTSSRSMTSSSAVPSRVDDSKPTEPPAELPHEKDVSADFGPMSRQDVFDAHGHDMHPQELVRLVGCHDAGAEAEQHPKPDSE